MTTASLTLIFVFWAAANLAADGVTLLSERSEFLRTAQIFSKISQWLVGAVFLIIIAEGWWQETLLQFSASPTAVFTVPIQDHGVKYVTSHDAAIISVFQKLFPLAALPFLAAVIGNMALRGVHKNGRSNRTI